MKIKLSTGVQSKLNDKHDGVTEDEIRQCFANLDRNPLIDSRARHLTNPVTRWFVAETDCGRLLKICYMPFSNGEYEIKTAYKPDSHELELFFK